MELKYIINSNFNIFKDINVPNNDALQNSFDLSSKNDLDIYKIEEYLGHFVNADKIFEIIQDEVF